MRIQEDWPEATPPRAPRQAMGAWQYEEADVLDQLDGRWVRTAAGRGIDSAAKRRTSTSRSRSRSPAAEPGPAARGGGSSAGAAGTGTDHPEHGVRAPLEESRRAAPGYGRAWADDSRGTPTDRAVAAGRALKEEEPRDMQALNCYFWS